MWKKIIQISDQKHLHDLSVNLLKAGVLSDDPDLKPNPYRTPGFPLFAGTIYTVFGAKPWVVLFLQCFLDTITCIMIFYILLQYFTLHVSFWTAVLYAIDPGIVPHTILLLSETLFNFIFVSGMLFLVTYFREENRKRKLNLLLASAIILALSAYVRPVTLYLPLLFISALLITNFKNKKLAVVHGLLFSVVFYIVLFPWYLRNLSEFNRFSFSTIGDHGTLILQVRPMMEEKWKLTAPAVQDILLNQADSLIKLDGKDPELIYGFEKGDYFRKLSNFYIKQNPQLFIKHYISGLVILYVNVPTRLIFNMLDIKMSQTDKDRSPFSRLFSGAGAFIKNMNFPQLLISGLSAVLYGISYCIALIGVYISVKKRNSVFHFFCIIGIIYLTLLAGASGNGRFKLPIIPLYLPLFALGLDFLQQILRNRQRRRANK
ncbi:MAG: glycosyltransferase family 39 protein [Ignavibacteriales bacterium]|nr:glycosyltransferase family 39 protein [Ignavibacteriales bacterium]